MDEFQRLVIIFTVMLVINVVVSAILWSHYRDALHRAQLGLWVGSVVNGTLQGLFGRDPWMLFAFGVGSFVNLAMLAELIGRALLLSLRWRVYFMAIGTSLVLTALATWMGAPFWIRALPVSIGSALPVLDIAFRALRLPRGVVSTSGRVLTVAAAVLGLHMLDYPFLRDDPVYAVNGVMIGMICILAIAVSAPAVVVDRRAAEVARLNEQLERRVNEALAALHARDEFLTIAAHEVRGPVHTLHLAIQTLQRTGPPPSHQKTLDAIARADRRLAHFVEELLDLGRTRAGTLTIQRGAIDLAEVVRDVAGQLQPEAARSGSSLMVHAEQLVVGEWDPFRLTQIVNNLLSNAIKYGLGKPIEISASAENGVATLVVSDQGMGIASDTRERLFQAFERGVPARHYGGLGLGLYIVRSIVTALGGEVSVRSEPSKGSTFAVTLPQGEEA